MNRLFQILILLALFLIGGCEKNEIIEPLTNTQKEALNYLPRESKFVVFLNLEELKKTDFWDNYFKTSLPGNKIDRQRFRKFEKETGIGDNFENYSGFIKENINNKSVYTLKGKFPLQFYFVNDSMLITAGNLNYIKTVINKTNNSLNNNKSFIRAIKNIRNKKQYWIATDNGEYALNYIRKFFNFGQKIPVNNVLKSIESVTFSVKFDNRLDIESKLDCNDSKNAYLLSAAIKGALAMDLLSGGDYSFGRILQKTYIKRLNRQVNLQLELNGNDINIIKDFAKQKNLERKL
ncbi:MAG: hypothetical protein P8Z35_14010 [Ignavibacteriaceae bacterium]